MTDPRNHAHYADWDGAYVLGALSPVERREYEAHLETCDRCRLAVADLSGLPGLLGRIDTARAFELLEDDSDDDAPPPPVDIVGRIERTERRRRTRRIAVIAAVAAAVLVAAGITVPLAITSAPHPTAAVALTPAVDSPLSAQVDLTTVAWGTKIDMRCAYAADNDWSDPADEGDWSYALWVVDTAGHATELSTWKATTGAHVRLSSGTALPIDRISAVQVRSVTTGDVLLAKRL